MTEKQTDAILREIKEKGKIETAKELKVVLERSIEVYGDMPIKISIPYRDGMGLHYEDIKNLSVHEGIFDIFTTVPENDDIKGEK